MGFRASIIRPIAKIVARRIDRWSAEAVAAQQKVFEQLIATGRRTAFGQEHGFERIQSYEAFRAQVPIRDYEGIRPYIERIKQGEADVLWRGFPKYFAKTSGTTSGVKYIPLTQDGPQCPVQFLCAHWQGWLVRWQDDFPLWQPGNGQGRGYSHRSVVGYCQSPGARVATHESASFLCYQLY